MLFRSNSGRSLEDQEIVVKKANRDGLVMPPCALLVRESFIYQYEGSYRGLEPWNSHALEKVLYLHKRIRALASNVLQELIERHGPIRHHISTTTTSVRLRNEEGADRFHAALKEQLACIPEASVTRNNLWVIVLHRELGKGAVLGAFMDKQGYQQDKVLAIGDNDNDLQILTGSICSHVGCPANSSTNMKNAVKRAGGTVSNEVAPQGTVEIITRFLNAT